MTLFPDQADATPVTTPHGFGAMVAGGKTGASKRTRRRNDFYPTPAEVARAFFLAEMPHIARHGTDAQPFWEPCGRGGAIAAAAREFGLSCIATDIVPDPANHVRGLDLLHAPRPLSRMAITNPPFGKLGARMLHRLLFDLECSYVALLLPTIFFNKGNQNGTAETWLRRPPARRWDMTWRVDFTGEGDPVMTTTWFVWDRAAPNDGTATHADLLTRDGPIGIAPPLARSK